MRFFLAGAAVPGVHAQSVNTLHLTGITFYELYETVNPQNSAIRLGRMRIDRQDANALGGSLVVTILNKPGCQAGSSQQFEFRWTFDGDVSQLVSKGSSKPPVVTETFQIRLLRANGICIKEDPSMTATYVQDPFGAQAVPPQKGMDYYFDPSRHVQYGPAGSGHASSHTPGPFQIFFNSWDNPGQFCQGAFRSPQTNAKPCSFSINVGSFSPALGFNWSVNYNYGAGPSTGGPSVVLCTDINFGGACQTFTADNADLRGSVIGNDTASSVRVGRACR